MSVTSGSTLATSFGGGGVSSTGFSFGKVMVFGRRLTWVTRGGVVRVGADGLAALGAASAFGLVVGLVGVIGGSQTIASPDLGGACCTLIFGWMNQIPTSSKCKAMAAIRP